MFQDSPSAAGDPTATARKGVPTAAIETAALLFRAAGDSERLRLLSVLAGIGADVDASDEFSVTELAARTDANLPAVSQRLRVLREAGLVDRRRDGKRICYRLCDDHVAALVRAAVAHSVEEHTHQHRASTDEHGR